MSLNESHELLALHLQELGLRFDPEYKYAPGRKFRADFAVWKYKPHAAGCKWTPPDGRFALIEIQGGIYTKQAHGSITGILADNERLYHAFKTGWPMLRFTPDQVKDGTARRMIEAAL